METCFRIIDGVILHLWKPGRSRSKTDRVTDAVVHKWFQGLPGSPDTVLISLLGRKHGANGDSEFLFYSFHGPWDSDAERKGRPSFQHWLDQWHTIRHIQILEHPTYDFCPILKSTLDAVASDISRLLVIGRTIVLMDSGGEPRTRQVCQYISFIEDTRSG